MAAEAYYFSAPESEVLEYHDDGGTAVELSIHTAVSAQFCHLIDLYFCSSIEYFLLISSQWSFWETELLPVFLMQSSYAKSQCSVMQLMGSTCARLCRTPCGLLEGAR